MPRPPTRSAGSRTPERLLPAALGGGVAALGFASGGYVPSGVGLTCAAIALLLVLQLTLAARPLGGLSAGYLAGTAALALLALWTLASVAWSDGTARVLVEYQRVLAVLLAFVVFGAAGRSDLRARWTVRSLAAGIVVVCVAGLASRVLPDVVTTTPGVADERLSHPVSYWNALGLLGATGALLCLGLSGDAREHPVTRVLAAAAIPLLAATVLLTFSRGSIAVGAGGLIVLVAALRSSALPAALLVAVPTAGIAAASAYGADLLSSADPRSDAATRQGHDVALVVGLCAVGAAAARAALLTLDRRMARMRPPKRSTVTGALAGVAMVGLLVAAASGAPGALERQYDRFVDGTTELDSSEGTRSRLTDPGNNGRLPQWEVALDAVRDEPVHGTGAGSYALRWDHDREEVFQVEDAHSLYLEVLGELGIIGLALVLAAVALVLAGLAARSRGPDRGPWAALLAGAAAWAVHAGVDWDWEMPVVTLWVFAAGGLALAAPAGGGASGSVPRLGRVLAGLAVVGLAILPVRLALSDFALRDSANAFLDGDCATAVDRSLDAISYVGSRPEPHAVLGYCNARLRQPRLAVLALERAVARDPGNWEFHYGLAVVRAGAGLDPRGSLNRAARLNPEESLVFRAQQAFATNDPEVWKRRALTARLPTD